jgi:hypothetical protein
MEASKLDHNLLLYCQNIIELNDFLGTVYHPDSPHQHGV